MNCKQGLLIRFLALLLLMTSLPACAAPGDTIEGSVLEEGTHKPLANVIVIGRWQETRSSFADAQTVCVHVETATTDADGRFRLSTYRGNAPTLLDSYKFGYERSDQYYKTQAYVRHQDILKPFTGTKRERLEYLRRVNSATGCGGSGESKKNLLPFTKALYEEARSLATTTEEKKIADNLLFSREIIELGYEAAERRDIERSRGQQ